MTKLKSLKNNQDVFDAIGKDPAIRRAVTRDSHAMFFSIYMPHYVKYTMAEFQKDIIRLTEDRTNKLACIVAFRGSAKSTLVTLSYSLWSILGVQQKKFVVILCQTQAQARQHMTNLRRELEQNTLLKSDLGPFQEETGVGEWAMTSLVFKESGARITVASIDQSVRGIRNREHRPDLLILDDIEDMGSTRTLEGRNKTFDWFTREIVPLGDIDTRIILVGNLLHEDSLMMRLKKKIDAKELAATYHWFPLINEAGTCLWPEKFDSFEKIQTLRQSVGSEFAWQQEYLLKIMSDSTRVVWPEWIQHYDQLPTYTQLHRMTAYGVDLAISQNTRADCTAIVRADLYAEEDGVRRIYVFPNPFNARIGFPETVAKLKTIMQSSSLRRTLYIENVGYQEAMIQQLRVEGIRAEGVSPNGMDKRSRLALLSDVIQSGRVVFPRHGCEALIAQLVGFGSEHHDDLADAFVIAVSKLLTAAADSLPSFYATQASDEDGEPRTMVKPFFNKRAMRSIYGPEYANRIKAPERF